MLLCRLGNTNFLFFSSDAQPPTREPEPDAGLPPGPGPPLPRLGVLQSGLPGGCPHGRRDQAGLVLQTLPSHRPRQGKSPQRDERR